MRSGAAAAEIDAWLRGGGAVVAASDRAVRAHTAAFHAARRREGLTAWPSPQIERWQSFVRTAWERRRGDDRLIMNPLQEKALWAEIVGVEQAALLEAPRQRLAELAMEAHALLCAFAPRFLNPKARNDWHQDAAAFSGWLAEFDAACRTRRLLSAAQLPLELLAALEEDMAARPPLLLVGFDRLFPIQQKVLEAWGDARMAAAGAPASKAAFYAAASEQAELAACAMWCRAKLSANPSARLLVVTQDLAARRGDMERAFFRFCEGDGRKPLFEFSLGVRFRSVALARGAYLILRWLNGVLEESEVDWLLSSGVTTASEPERYALTGFMHGLRRRGEERTRWTLDAFLARDRNRKLPAVWAARVIQAKRRLAEAARRPQAAWAWAELAQQLLEAAGWPGQRSKTSAEFQALRQWQQTLDACASLGFDGRPMNWSEFVAVLGGAMEETLFAPESREAPIQIAGAAESAGLRADGIWFLGVSEDAWPAPGAMHPLIPFAVQREAGMPHAAPHLDWELANSVTARLLASAPEVNFSFARQKDGVKQRASRLATTAAVEPTPLPAEFALPGARPALSAEFEDFSHVPLAADKAAGGSTILTAQSQCPFKAFAGARLGAQRWEPARAGLTAGQRGQLLHEVLHSIWSESPHGIRTHAQLAAIEDLRGFVENHVQLALAQALPAAARELMPQRYLQLEGDRLTSLVTGWLEFECGRAPFEVAATEFEKDTVIAGLSLCLRLDRLDRLNDGTFLVIDYKTGDVATKQWELPRPEDVQLPLYAGFALDREEQPLGGLVFAKIRAGQYEFAGRVGDVQTTLLPNLGARHSLAKTPLTPEEIESWRAYIERMARDFLDGCADVDPLDPVKTCQRCKLHGLCRVREAGVALNGDEEEAGDD